LATIVDNVFAEVQPRKTAVDPIARGLYTVMFVWNLERGAEFEPRKIRLDKKSVSIRFDPGVMTAICRAKTISELDSVLDGLMHLVHAIRAEELHQRTKTPLREKVITVLLDILKGDF